MADLFPIFQAKGFTFEIKCPKKYRINWKSPLLLQSLRHL
jgi:hypothetical protein